MRKTLWSGLGWTLLAQLGPLKKDQVERNCSKDICGAPKVWDRLD